MKRFWNVRAFAAVWGVLSVLVSSASVSAGGIQAPPFEGPCTPDNKFCVYFSPTDMPVHAVGKVLESARRTIRIATYNISVQEYLPILKKKLDDGVKIELMVDYLQSLDGKIFNVIHNHPNLTRVRLPVLRGGTPQMHNKIILVDNETLLMGSANFTYSGLVANYENVLSIRGDANANRIINNELDELRDNGRAACSIILGSSQACGTGDVIYEKHSPEFHALLTEGEFPKEVNAEAEKQIEACAGKATRLNRGLLDELNQPPLDAKQLQACAASFKPEDRSVAARVVRLWQSFSQREKLVDGRPASGTVAAFRAARKALFEVFKDEVQGQTQYPSLEKLVALKKTLDAADGQGNNKVRIYNGPEDNLEAILLREMLRATEDPKNSFIYVATNFITHSRIAKALVTLNRAGVRIRTFFDRGRYLDPNFQSAIGILKPLGFVEPGQSVYDLGDSRVISVFDNALTSDYGSNHNKFMVVGTPKGLRLLSGSANWSNSAVDKNDENVVVIDDSYMAAIYLRELVSQLFVYRYFQREDAPAFQEELQYLIGKSPCAGNLLGREQASCKAGGQPWRPTAMGSAALSLRDVPADPANESVWVWVPQLNNNQGGALRLFTNHEFGGKWVTTVPLAPGWDMSFKFFKVPRGYDPNVSGLGSAQWEYGGSGNDRRLTLGSLAVQVVRGQYVWGQP